jgi:hypothetical protein
VPPPSSTLKKGMHCTCIRILSTLNFPGITSEFHTTTM